MKYNRSKLTIIAVLLTVMIISISLGQHYLVTREAATLEMCAVDFGVLILGKGILTELLLPLIISLAYCYVLQYLSDNQHLVRSESRSVMAYKTLTKIAAMCAVVCLATQIVAILAGLCITGNICNWEFSNSMFSDEVYITQLSITEIPNPVIISIQAFVLGFLNCLFRCIAAVCVATAFDAGWLSAVVIFAIKLILPHRILNDKFNYFVAKYRPTSGNYYGELVHKDVYVELILFNIILVAFAAMVLMPAVRKKDYLR